MMIATCDILSKCTTKIYVMEWILADRQGIDKNGKSNTQIKLGHSFLHIRTQPTLINIHGFWRFYTNGIREGYL